MRSGVIVKKVGMTRLFMEDGRHVPVTVLKVDNCQVVAHKTPEKHGYSALQLGVELGLPRQNEPGEAGRRGCRPIPGRRPARQNLPARTRCRQRCCRRRPGVR